MRKMKRLLAVLLTTVLVMAMGISAAATSDENSGNNDTDTPAVITGSITVTNATSGETYTLYKVFDATVAEGREHDSGGISYTSSWPVPENDYFDEDSQGNITIKDAGKTEEGELSDGAIAWLKSQIESFEMIGQPVVASSTTVIWEDLAPGYYYVNTTTGSFITVDSITPDVEIEDKNTLPSHNKKQATAADGTYSDDLVELNIGDTVYYETEITIGKGSDKAITLTDEMASGLDLVDGITVKKGGSAVDESSYTLEASEHGFELVLIEAYVKTLNEGDVIVVGYSAVINKDAVIDSATGNYNNATLEYSEQTATDSVYVATYDFQLKKTDGIKFLDGSGFKLYDAETEGNQIVVAKDSTGYYVDQSDSKDPSVQIMVDSENGVNVRGLAPGDYYLEETTTPDGYNTLTAREPVTITANQTSAPEVIVKNSEGAELPSTGGIGTKVFFTVGAVLVIVAGVLLIARRRTEK